MNETQIWKISENLDDLIPYAETETETKLLKLNIDGKYNVLENTVLQIAHFHLKRLNMVLDDFIHIEFWLKKTSDIHNYHVDCDEYEKKENKQYYHPFISCITYLNDHSNPTFISNINYEDYKYKQFEDQLGFSLIFPEKGKHITFDGSKYHGVTSLHKEDESTSRYILAINIWNKRKPTMVEYYNHSETNFPDKHILTFIEQTEILHKIECKDNDTINDSIFNDLFYNKNSNKIIEIGKWKDISKNMFISFFNKDKNIIDFKKNVQTDLDCLTKDTNSRTNRFLQRFIMSKIYSENICKWIIEEGEKHASKNGGWTTQRHTYYPTTDLPIKDIPSISNYIVYSFSDIINKIIKIYGLYDSKINILDLFLVKYHEHLQNELEFHRDGSILSVNISLNHKSEYEGGGTIFEDGMHYTLDQGDILIHCGKLKHAGVKITKGCRYILVAFLDVKL
jgi:hypothetical protein